MKTNESDGISRRRLLLSLPALMMTARKFAQSGNSPIRVKGYNHVTLSVSDVKRSTDFYQGLFGTPIISRQGQTANLRIGSGPQFLGVSAAGSTRPNINHICFGVDGFNVDVGKPSMAASEFLPDGHTMTCDGCRRISSME